jgi:hypothetical protein
MGDNVEDAMDMAAREALSIARDTVAHRLGGHRAALSHAARLGYPLPLVDAAAATLVRGTELEWVLGVLDSLLEPSHLVDGSD